MPRRDGQPVLIGLVLAALGLIAAGGFLAVELSRSHRPLDLAYSEGPRAFQAWLALSRRDAPGGRQTGAAVSTRLLSMPIAARRRTVAAMTDEAFWAGMAADAAGRRALQASVRAAVLAALKQAPAAGDLWLAAAYLHTILDGFDEKAARYLAASYRFAPREGQVAYARAGLIAHVLPVLEGRLAETAAADLAVIEAEYPRLSQALGPALEATGTSGARR